MENLNRSILTVGGYVEASSISGNSYNRNRMRSADITARIPAEQLDAFCDQVSDLGNVTYKNLYTRDVTLTYVDLESHVKALRTEQQTLMDLLAKAEKVEDIILIQNRLSDVLYEIESYESTLRTFDDQITYSSVHLSIQEVARETTVEKETAAQEIARRFKENWEDVKEGAEGAVQDVKEEAAAAENKAEGIVEGVKDDVKDAVDGLKDGAGDVVDAVKDKVGDVVEAVKDKLPDIGSFFSSLLGNLPVDGELGDQVGEVITDVSRSAPEGSGIGDIINTIIEKLKSTFSMEGDIGQKIQAVIEFLKSKIPGGKEE
jgi:flagellar hook-basal body complex protein FliE